MTLVIASIIAGVLLGAFYCFVACGFHVALGVLNVVNFAYGTFVVCGSYLAYVLKDWIGLDPLLSTVVAAPLFFALGMALTPVMLRSIDHMTQIFVTFGLSLVIQGLLVAIFGPDVRSTGASSLVAGSWHIGSVTISIPRVVLAACALAVLVALGLYLQRTYKGAAMRAIAQNRRGAAVIGVHVSALARRVLGISAAIAGIAGTLTAVYQPFSPDAGLQTVIIAFIVTALGGLGSLRGLFLAAMVVALLQAFSLSYLPAVIYTPLIYAVLIVVLWARPTGLRGERTA